MISNCLDAGGEDEIVRETHRPTIYAYALADEITHGACKILTAWVHDRVSTTMRESTIGGSSLVAGGAKARRWHA